MVTTAHTAVEREGSLAAVLFHGLQDIEGADNVVLIVPGPECAWPLPESCSLTLCRPLIPSHTSQQAESVNCCRIHSIFKSRTLPRPKVGHT